MKLPAVDRIFTVEGREEELQANFAAHTLARQAIPCGWCFDGGGENAVRLPRMHGGRWAGAAILMGAVAAMAA